MRTKQKQIRAEDLVAPPATDHMVRGDYPLTWETFVGQDRAKRILRREAQAARIMGKSLPHTLIADGAQGIGKTSLALLTANEMGAHCKMASGQIKDTEARMLFAGMTDGDILIIDEVHRMAAVSSRNTEWLLHYLQDGVLLGPLGVEEVPKVTIIACTTEKGRLLATVLDRFKIEPPLERYSDSQGAQIAAVTAARVFGQVDLPSPTTANCKAVACAANNNPRIMRNLLESLRSDALTGGADFRSRRGYDLSTVLEDNGLTPDGLNVTAQRYLTSLFQDFNGGPTGKSAMQDRLQEPGGLTTVEQLLQEKGYMKKIQRGRCLTQSGIHRARALTGLEVWNAA